MCSIADLIQKGLSPSELNDFSVRYLGDEGIGIDGYLLETATGKGLSQGEVESGYFCKIKKYRKEKEEPDEEIIHAKRVFPESRPELIQVLLERLGIDFDVIGLMRTLSFLDSPTASKDRFVHTKKIIDQINEQIFPLKFGDFVFNLNTQPIIIKL